MDEKEKLKKKNDLDCNKKARAKYIKENIKVFSIAFNKKTDTEIIAVFEKVKNKADFVRQAIEEKLLGKAE